MITPLTVAIIKSAAMRAASSAERLSSYTAVKSLSGDPRRAYASSMWLTSGDATAVAGSDIDASGGYLTG